MPKPYLCVGNSANHPFIFKAGTAGLEPASDATKISGLTSVILKDISEKGVYVRDEHFAPGQIMVGRKKVGPENALYLTGCAEVFEEHGWKAFIYSPDKSELFRRLYEANIPEDLRASFVDRLNALSEDELKELKDILDRADRRVEKP